MLSREEIITLLRKNYPYLSANYGVKKIGLFGSYAKGQWSNTSDIELVIESECPIGLRFVELEKRLQKVLYMSRRTDREYW